jgi:amidase
MHSFRLLPVFVLGSALGISGQGTGTTGPLFPLQQNANTPALFPMPPCGTFILEEATIDQMQQALGNGTLTSQQLVMCYMQRMYQTDEYIK